MCLCEKLHCLPVVYSASALNCHQAIQFIFFPQQIKMSAARAMAAVPISVSTRGPPSAVDAQMVTLSIQIKRRVIQVTVTTLSFSWEAWANRRNVQAAFLSAIVDRRNNITSIAINYSLGKLNARWKNWPQKNWQKAALFVSGFY